MSAEDLFRANRWTEAEKAFSAYASRHPRPLDAGAALLRIADCQTARGDRKKASATLRSIANDSETLRREPDAVATAWARLHAESVRDKDSPATRLRILANARSKLPRHPRILRLCEAEADAQLSGSAFAKAADLYAAADASLSPTGTNTLELLRSCGTVAAAPLSAAELRLLRTVFVDKPLCSESLASHLASRRKDGWTALDALARWRLEHADAKGAVALWDAVLRSRKGPEERLSLSRAEAAAVATPREGLAAFDNWLNAHPQSSLRPRAEILRMSHLLSRADFAAARTAAERFLSDYPADPLCAEATRIRESAAEAQSRAELAENALAEQRRRREADPDLADVVRAETLLSEGKADAAEAVFRRVSDNPKSRHRARAAVGLGRALRERGDTASALKIWETLWWRRASLSAEEAPYAAHARRCMADVVLEEEGNPEKARAAYAEADAFHKPDLPGESSVRAILRVSALALCGDVDGARAIVERRRAGVPADSADALRWDALVKRLEDGTLAPPRGVEKPALRAARYRLAQADAQLSAGDAKRALRAYRAVGAVRDAAALADRADFGAAMSLSALGRAKDAAEMLLAFPRRHRESPLAPAALLHAGTILANPPLRSTHRAAKAFAEIAASYPKAAEVEAADFYAATLAWKERKWGEARHLHEEFLRRHPTSRLAPMVRESRLPAIARKSTEPPRTGDCMLIHSVTVHPYDVKRRVFRMDFSHSCDGVLSIKAADGCALKSSDIVRVDPQSPTPYLWHPDSKTPSYHEYYLTSAYSSQEHVVIAGEFRTPPQGSGPPPTFTVAVPAVDIDWEGRTRWDDETDEGGFIAPVLLSSNPDHWKKVIINDPRPRDIVSPALTISWIPASAIMLRRMDGRTVSNGEVIHSKSESFPLSLNVVPLTTNSLFSITLEGETDSYGEKAIDKVFGTIYTAQLFVNGEDKTDGETTVVVGQNVVAELRIIPDKNPFEGPLFPAQPTFQWTIPGADDFPSLWTIKDYQPTPFSATVKHLTLDDRSKQVVSMYWLDAITRDPVSCAIDVDGHTLSLTTFITATKPQSTFLTELTSHRPMVNVYSDGYHNKELSFGSSFNIGGVVSPGIKFMPSITTFDNQSGTIAIFQLINLTGHFVSDFPSFLLSNGFVLDSDRASDGIIYSVPYSGITTGVPDNGTASLFTDDSPGVELRQPNTCIEFEDHFLTYFMYKPFAGSKRIWVPLKVLSWEWHGRASITNGEWFLDFGSSTQTPPVGENCVYPPIWEKNIHQVQLYP